MSKAKAEPGRLVIISGPSGVGKSTIVRELLRDPGLPLVLSVSATTRPPRIGEVDGVQYHFLTDSEFQERRKNGEFLECMEVFGRGYWYGTLSETVTTGLKQGKWVLLEIDVDGAAQVLEKYDQAITIFLHPGSIKELERRLRGRNTDSEQAIQRRLHVAQYELERSSFYRHIVMNDHIDEAVAEIRKILIQSGATV
jgi:guanylate kinase